MHAAQQLQQLHRACVPSAAGDAQWAGMRSLSAAAAVAESQSSHVRPSPQYWQQLPPLHQHSDTPPQQQQQQQQQYPYRQLPAPPSGLVSLSFVAAAPARFVCAARHPLPVPHAADCDGGNGGAGALSLWTLQQGQQLRQG